MPTKGPSEQQEEERNIELENTIGNLMVAEYQVDRLRNRLSDRILDSALQPTKEYTHTFKHGNRWYKITLKLGELTINERQDIE